MLDVEKKSKSLTFVTKVSLHKKDPDVYTVAVFSFLLTIVYNTENAADVVYIYCLHYFWGRFYNRIHFILKLI